MFVSSSFTNELLSWGADRSLRILYIRVAFAWKRLVSRVFQSSSETDFIPEPRAQTLPLSKYGRKRTQVERDHYVSWDKIVF